LWIGTDNGLLRQRLQKPFIAIENLEASSDGDDDGPYDKVILSMLDYKGRLYVGRYVVEDGLLVLDPATLEIIKKVNFFPGLPGANVIRSLQVYHEDTLWMGTDQGMLWYSINSDAYGKVSELRDDPHFNSLDILAPVHRDGTAWACGLLKGTAGRYDVRDMRLQHFDAMTSPPMPFKGTKHIVYDSHGQVWIGGHGLTRWNEQASAFDTLITAYSGPNKFNENILMMQADSQGSLWIVNLHNGLLRYKINSGEWEHYGSMDGLPSDIIQSMSPVVDDHIWLYTPHHLSRFSIADGSIRSYDESDGLMARHVEGKDIYYHPASGYFLLPVNNFIARWKKDEAPAAREAGALFCEQIDLGGNQTIYFPGDVIRLGYENRDLHITYAILDFEGAEQYQFAYRLQPNGQWTDIGSQRSISLANLSPGSYTMDFRARSISGVERTHQYGFIIRPPFWQTAWFVSAMLILLSMLGIWLYRRRIAFISMRANIDNQLSRAEMKALHAQMNPHFIFNSLNSIRKLVLNNENHEASRYLGKFAHLIRLTLDQSRQSFITLRQTIDYLQRYIELEKIRNPKFTCIITVDPSLDPDEIVMPPMLIQPFVENAIWHGLPADGEAIEIKVQFDRDGDQMIATVDDNGVGIEASIRERDTSAHRHPAVGIDNIRSRIALLNKKHNLQSSMQLLDKSELDHGRLTGTRVILRLPIDMHDE
jgi:two-component sensor histidine kinase/streptogramin lyase